MSPVDDGATQVCRALFQADLGILLGLLALFVTAFSRRMSPSILRLLLVVFAASAVFAVASLSAMEWTEDQADGAIAGAMLLTAILSATTSLAAVTVLHKPSAPGSSAIPLWFWSLAPTIALGIFFAFSKALAATAWGEDSSTIAAIDHAIHAVSWTDLILAAGFLTIAGSSIGEIVRRRTAPPVAPPAPTAITTSTKRNSASRVLAVRATETFTISAAFAAIGVAVALGAATIGSLLGHKRD